MTLSPFEVLSLWELPSCKRLAELARHEDRGWSLDLSPDGLRLAWAHDDTVHVWECARNKEVGRFALPGQSIGAVAFERDGQAFLVFISGGPAYLFNLATNQRLTCLPGLAEGTAWKLSRGPDGRVLVWKRNPRNTESPMLHEALTDRPIGAVPSKQPWTMSPDGRLLATGGGTVRLVETATGRVLATLPAGHRGGVSALAFSPDGRTLATGGADSTILLWDCAAVRRLEPPRRDVTLPELWKALAATDPATGWNAIDELAGKPADALRLLQENLKPVRAEDVTGLKRRIQELEDRRFAARQRATQELETTLAEWEFVFREAILAEPVLEVRRRLETIREAPALRQFSPEAVRALRGVQVLERIGTVEARRLLKQLADGLPGARLTQDAKDSLRRLAVTPK